MDKISEMLTKIKNAQSAGHREVFLRPSKIKMAIADIFKKEGFVEDVVQSKDGKEIKIILKYNRVSNSKKVGVINGIRKISRPGQRIYIKSKEIKRVKSGYGTAVISTPRGIMTGEESRKLGIGGEYICEIW